MSFTAARLLSFDNNDLNAVSLIANLDKPTPLQSEVLVKVQACTLSSNDLRLSQGKYAGKMGFSKDFPQKDGDTLSLGFEIAGTVEAVGDGVTAYRKGDKVVGILPLHWEWSGCAEYCVCPYYCLVPQPISLTAPQAAACIGQGLEAYTALQYLGRVVAGELVLVYEGARNLLLLQLLVDAGARVVVTYDSPEGYNALQDLPQPMFRMIDAANEDVWEIVHVETGGLGVDLLIDLSGTLPKKQAFAALGLLGRFVTTNSALQLSPPDVQVMQLKQLSFSLLHTPSWSLLPTLQGKLLHILEAAINLIANKKFKQLIVTQPLARIREALRVLPQTTVGVVVLLPDANSSLSPPTT
eukprot:GCRY01004729.1.p1 GENE.GCRY01004729.1~~GCRY01004729.1.p1  ORF type:complete len:354 (-),score=92.52 GCRY01004729.1:244-1305(-)